MLPSRSAKRCRHRSRSTLPHISPLQTKDKDSTVTYLSEEEMDKADAWADKDLTEYWSYPEIGQDREVEDAEES